MGPPIAMTARVMAHLRPHCCHNIHTKLTTCPSKSSYQKIARVGPMKCEADQVIPWFQTLERHPTTYPKWLSWQGLVLSDSPTSLTWMGAGGWWVMRGTDWAGLLELLIPWFWPITLEPHMCAVVFFLSGESSFNRPWQPCNQSLGFAKGWVSGNFNTLIVFNIPSLKSCWINHYNLSQDLGQVR